MNDPHLLPQASLANWRKAPFNIWGFSHVDKILTTSRIEKKKASPLPYGEALDLATLRLADGASIADTLAFCHTDAFMALHDGKIVAEFYRGASQRTLPHIVFSVSKSITGTLAGVLVGRGELDPDAPVTRYVPETQGSAYGDCLVRHVLDMTVSVGFIEDYLDPTGDVARYRRAMDWDPPQSPSEKGGVHDFICGLKKDKGPHGAVFHYVSPNSDLLGWILERAGGRPLPELLSRDLWQPLGAESDAFITLDRFGAPRAAGGICVTLPDLARFGEMMRLKGRANGAQIIPEAWIDDILTAGDRKAWKAGTMTHLFPSARYRSKWYVPDDVPGEFCAIGIHGQWIYVDPKTRLTVIKLSSEPTPVGIEFDKPTLNVFRALGAYFGR